MIEQASKRGEVLRFMWSENNPGLAIGTVAEACELSVSGLRRMLRHLVAEGLISRTEGRCAVVKEYGSTLMGAPFAGSRAIRRTPDIWRLTDTGLALVEGWMAEVPDAH